MGYELGAAGEGRRDGSQWQISTGGLSASRGTTANTSNTSYEVLKSTS